MAKQLTATTALTNNPLVIAPNPLNSMKYEPALGSGFMLTYNNTSLPIW